MRGFTAQRGLVGLAVVTDGAGFFKSLFGNNAVMLAFVDSAFVKDFSDVNLIAEDLVDSALVNGVAFMMLYVVRTYWTDGMIN
jgi:hypothetical protein